MCTDPKFHPHPAPGGGGDFASEDPEYDPLHQGKRPKELTLSQLLERITVMSQLRPILLLLTGHDHCPICLGCRRPRDGDNPDAPEGDQAPEDGNFTSDTQR